MGSNYLAPYASTLFLVLLCVLGANQKEQQDPYVQAKDWLESRGVWESSHRLMIHGLTGENACCLTKNLEEMVLPHTPADIYIFSIDNYGQHWAGNCPSENVIHLPLTRYWEVPKSAGPKHLWTNTYFHEDYRKMGHWRLHYPFELGRRLGYEYTLQLDDDSHFSSPVKFNIVHFLYEHKIKMAAQAIHFDSPQYCVGLPELTRYFLTVKNIVPQTLFNQCSPANLHGLYTRASGESEGGWNMKYLYGNCLAISISFWYEDTVQSYLQLIVNTGGHFRFRWNEQGVMAMIWQIFVPPEQFQLLPIDYVHPRKCPRVEGTG